MTIRGNAALTWVDSDDVSVERVLLLREPLREIRPAAVQSIFAADSLDYSQRQTFYIGQGVDELVGRVRYMDDPQGCIDLLKAGTKQRTVTYIPDLDDPNRSFDCYLISPLVPTVLTMDADMGTDFGLREFEIRLRQTSGAAFDVNWLYDQSILFRYRAGGRTTNATFGRGSAATYFDKFGILQSATSVALRTHWVDLDGDMVRETPTTLLEKTATNIVLWNRDLSNAAWTKTNITAAHDKVGIDGVTNSASSISASAGNGTCLQAITLASSVRFQSAYVKRFVGSGVIQMTMDNGATWTAITVTDTVNWTRVSIPTQTLANPTVGFRIVTNGDAIGVDFLQNETDTYATSPIATTTVAVTRAGDFLTFPFVSRPQAMWAYCQFVELGGSFASVQDSVTLFGLTVAPNRFQVINGGSSGEWETDVSNTATFSRAPSGTPDVLNASTELLCSCSAVGLPGLRQSLSGGAETVAPSPDPAATLQPAWSTTSLGIGGSSIGTNQGCVGIRTLVIGSGSMPTLAQARTYN